MILDHLIWVIIPAYNEEKMIYSTLKKIPKFVDQILVINDGSTDGTKNEVSRFMTDYSEIRCELINHRRNLGKGHALVQGFKWISKNKTFIEKPATSAIVLLDADGQMDPALIKKMINPILVDNVNFVKASRFKHKNDNLQMPKFRKIGNIILKHLTRIASGQWDVSDPQNGYFAMSGGVLNKINYPNLDNGYFFENDMLIKLGINRLKVHEIPLPAIYGQGEVSSIQYKRFIPITSLKLLKGWATRLFVTSHYNIVRRLCFISLVSTLFLIMYSLITFKLNFIILGLIFSSLGLTIILDYKDYKNWE